MKPPRAPSNHESSAQQNTRVLHVMGRMTRAGAETVVMNFYRVAAAHHCCQFDFLVMVPGEHSYDREIRDLGGRIFYVPAPRPLGLVPHIIRLVTVMRRYGPFGAVHCHTSLHCGIVMLAAVLARVPVRISHSHTAPPRQPESVYRRIYAKIMRAMILTFANRLVACSHSAGHYLFGGRAMQAGRVAVLPNPLDLGTFEHLDSSVREDVRLELGIPKDSFVLGHVGRLSAVKNHSFLIAMFRHLAAVRKGAYLLVVGDGELRSQLEAEVKRARLSRQVLLLGERTDVPRILKALDVFVFPSLYEGFGMAVVEAQAAGTPCLVATTVPREVDVGLGLVHFEDLHEGPQVWAVKAQDVARVSPPNRDHLLSRLRAQGYDVRTSVRELMKVYGH